MHQLLGLGVVFRILGSIMEYPNLVRPKPRTYYYHVINDTILEGCTGIAHP